MEYFIFSRNELAEKYSDALTSKGLLSFRDGLFLAAPRRTGKSTFIQHDLMPMLEKKGFVTVYTDLWADKSVNPSDLISRAIQKKLNAFADPLSRLAKKTGIEKVNLYGILNLNLNKSQNLPTNILLSDALEVLSDASGCPVALLIDEAQHALMTEEGANAMFALKSARDTLNIAGSPIKLALVFTGSNRDKLASLTLDHKQPFYGVQVKKFPLLDKQFTDSLTEYYNDKLSGNLLSPDITQKAFAILGSRPSMLRTCIQDGISEYLESEGFDVNSFILKKAESIKEKMIEPYWRG